MARERTLELKDFISKSLSDICSAVEEVRNQYPYVATDHTHYPTNDKPTHVEFDVAVTVSDTSDDSAATNTGVGGGFKISVLKAETRVNSEEQKSSSENTVSENRIKFSIPVYFHVNKEDYVEYKKREVR